MGALRIRRFMLCIIVIVFLLISYTVYINLFRNYNEQGQQNHLGTQANAPQQIKFEETKKYDRTPISKVPGQGSHLNSSLRNNTKLLRKPKIIHFYNPIAYYNYWMGDTWETSKILKNCPVSDCIITKEKRNFDIADAVVFKMRDLTSCPKRTKWGQTWIFCEFESPEYIMNTKVIGDCSNTVNWTLTYRRDADFGIVHGYIRKRKTPNKNKFNYKTKTKTAAVFISHCDDPLRRMDFIKKLQSYNVNVDVWGACGKLKCSDGNRFKIVLNMTTKETEKCFSVLDTTYRFYLSLENAHCIDYITEKSLDMVLRRQVVPIIRDGVNHSMFHPPGSYINVKDFPNIKSLADYILKVEKDMLLYEKYHEWREYYESEGFRYEWDKAFCNMCARLHNVDKYRRLYNRLDEWFLKPDDAKACSKPNDIK